MCIAERKYYVKTKEIMCSDIDYDKIFIIEKGSVIVLKNNKFQKKLNKGEYFGGQFITQVKEKHLKYYACS